MHNKLGAALKTGIDVFCLECPPPPSATPAKSGAFQAFGLNNPLSKMAGEGGIQAKAQVDPPQEFNMPARHLAGPQQKCWISLRSNVSAAGTDGP